jgi:predicted dehydrogenase
MQRIAIVGYGLMGRTHEAAFQWAAAQGFECSTEVLSSEDAVQRDDIDAVCICTPTDTHVDIAAAAMRAGKHVMLEKPVALQVGEVARLADVALKTKRLCMPAHCMRFWPGWPLLRDVIQHGTYGAVRAAAFTRIAATPDWNDAFYHDRKRSGGALFDLHIHDVDFILWCFGEPQHVECDGTIDDVTARYVFEHAHAFEHAGGRPASAITARGAWLTAGTPFSMRYHVALEQATFDFAHDGTPPLTITRNGRSEAVPLPAATAYEVQAAHFVEALTGHTPLQVTLADAQRVTHWLSHEARLVSA